MKTLITALLFAISLNAVGQTKPFKFEAMKYGASEEIAQLTRNMCSQYAGDATKVGKSIKEILVNFLMAEKKAENPNLKQVPPPSSEEMVKFLNKYKNQMLCGNTHYMVESFRHGAYHQLFNVFLYGELLTEGLVLRDEPLFVDINAISYTGGVTENDPETVLDFMYREVKVQTRSKGSRREIQDLIDFFETEEIDGKRFAELTDEEQAAAQKRKPK